MSQESTDRFVRNRERLINGLLRVSPRVLDGEPAGHVVLSEDVPGYLYRTMAELQCIAVDDGGYSVDYEKIRASNVYPTYRAQVAPALSHFDPETLPDRESRLAFWIDLYNLLVIDAVIRFGIRKSITEGFLGILRFFRRAAYNVGGRRLSLDDIEQGILRANRGYPYFPGDQFGPSDPRRAWVVEPFEHRIHWGLNCASRSCPPLRTYRPETVDAALDEAARHFIGNTVKMHPDRREVHVSSLFKWFAGDFGGASGVIDYVLSYLPRDDRHDWLSRNRTTAKVVHQPYDWSLNDKAVKRNAATEMTATQA